MKTLLPHRRTIAAVMLTLFAAASFAPAADAGHAYGNRRWKGGPPVREVRYSQPGWYGSGARVYHRSSNAGPLLAGIVGGLVLGAALSHAQPVVHADYSYWDPYCDEGFVSLDSYQSHLYRHRHPRVVRVIEVDNGQCVRSMHWDNGNWCNGGYEGGGYDRGYSRDDDDGDWDR